MRWRRPLSEYGVKTLGIVCDVIARDQVDALVQQTIETLGRVDILVNNAGRNILSPVAEMTDEQWDTDGERAGRFTQGLHPN